MQIQKNSIDISKKSSDEANHNDVLFIGLIIFILIYYFHIANRIPILRPIRIEFVVGSLCVFFSIFRIIGGRVNLNENRLNLYIIIFFTFVLFTIPFAYVKARTLERLIQILKFFSIYLMIVTTIDSEKKLKTFYYIYFLIISLNVLEPFILSLQGKGFIYNNYMTRLAGPAGPFAHPNAFGMFLSSHLPFFYYSFRYEKKNAFKILYFLMMIISIRCLMLTQSRTGFLGLLVFACLLFFQSKKKILTSLAIIIGLSVVWFYAPQETKNRFLTLSESNRVISEGRDSFGSIEESMALSSMATRWELMKRTVIAFKENPVIGLGLDCFTSYSGRRWGHWIPPHNTYLQALAELGIIGFSLLMMIVYQTLKNLNTAKGMLDEITTDMIFYHKAIRSITAYYLIYLVIAFFGIELYSNFWWFIGGLSIAFVRVISKKNIKINNDKPLTN